MATDALLVLQASVTKAASFNGAGLSLPGGTPRRGLFVRVLYSAASSTSTNTATFGVDVSPDGGSTWYAHTSGAEDVLSLTTTAQAGEIFLPIQTDDTMIRLTLTVAGAGTASVTYQGDVVDGYPA